MPANLANLELTSAERATLDVYTAYVAQHGSPPSLRALATMRGVAVATIQWHLKRLREKGALSAPRKKAITRTRLTLASKGKRR